MKRRKSSFVATSHCRFLVSLIHLGRPFLCIRKFNLDPHARRLFGLSKWNHSDGFSLCALANWNVKWNPNTETDRRPPVPLVPESWVMTSRHDKPYLDWLCIAQVFSLAATNVPFSVSRNRFFLNRNIGSGNEVLFRNPAANHFKDFADFAVVLSFLLMASAYTW